MPEQPVYDGLHEIFRDVFFRDDIDLTAATTARDIDGWDSFRQVEIILAVEERFRIKVSSREVDTLKSVGDLAAVIQKGITARTVREVPAELPAVASQPPEPAPAAISAASEEKSAKETAPLLAADMLATLTELRKQRRLQDAAVFVEEAVQAFPKDVRLRIMQAEIAHLLHDYERAANLWMEGCQDFPNRERFLLGASKALRLVRRLDEADSIAQAASERFPKNWKLLTEYATVAHFRKSYDEAQRRWAVVRERFPDLPVAHWRLALVLSQAGRLDEAEEVITAALERYPNDPDVLWQWAVSATRREDRPEAMRRWTIAAERCPDSRGIANGLANLRMAMHMDATPQGDDDDHEEADSPFERVGRPELDPAIFPPENDIGEFLLNFESLGDNCEFGVVQRIAGVEPIGLLRWGGISIASLTKMLNNRLEQVGDPDFVHLRLNDRGKYSLRDPRYFAMHTFIDEGHMPEPALRDLLIRRVVFLRNKLISDLTDGEKIFVYKSRKPQTLKEVIALHDAARIYGRIRLLYVQKEIMPELNADIVKVRGGLVCASLPKIVTSPHGARNYFPDWVKILVETKKILDTDVPLAA